MFELTIKNTVYQFNFGIGFVRDINKTVKRPIEGIHGAAEDVGFELAVARIMDGDAIALVDVLELANKGYDPRVTRADLEGYIDDETTDIERLFEDVLDFFERANATKKKTVKMRKAMKEAEAEAANQ